MTSGLSDYEVTTTWGGEKTFSVFLHRQCVGDFIILRGVGTTVNLLKRNPNDERQLGLAPEERRHV